MFLILCDFELVEQCSNCMSRGRNFTTQLFLTSVMMNWCNCVQIEWAKMNFLDFNYFDLLWCFVIEFAFSKYILNFCVCDVELGSSVQNEWAEKEVSRPCYFDLLWCFACTVSVFKAYFALLCLNWRNSVHAVFRLWFIDYGSVFSGVSTMYFLVFFLLPLVVV